MASRKVTTLKQGSRCQRLQTADGNCLYKAIALWRDERTDEKHEEIHRLSYSLIEKNPTSLRGTLDEVSDLLAAKQTEKAEEKVAELSKNLKRRQKIIKLADKSEAGWLAVKEYQTEELASDSEDEKRIRKAQERALKEKKQNVSRKQDRDRNSSLGASRFRATNDDRMLFRGIVLALSLYFTSFGCTSGKCSHSACLSCCSVFYASAYWRRKIIFLRTNAVRKTEI
ncbi:uncharacterized protein [Montipora capricornis]|uniref:uncharacterized protein n=1 Tax=Montipora capricornis TaxID=246305 RepID=UPI0035F12918